MSATFIAGALRAHGYTVLEAANAQEALEIVRTNQAPIHLLLTDVVMPGMNGRELSELVVGMRCDTRVLFMSGYSDDAVLRHGVETAGAHFLQKPFSIGALTTHIREALASTPLAVQPPLRMSGFSRTYTPCPASVARQFVPSSFSRTYSRETGSRLDSLSVDWIESFSRHLRGERVSYSRHHEFQEAMKGYHDLVDHAGRNLHDWVVEAI